MDWSCMLVFAEDPEWDDDIAEDAIDGPGVAYDSEDEATELADTSEDEDMVEMPSPNGPGFLAEEEVLLDTEWDFANAARHSILSGVWDTFAGKITELDAVSCFTLSHSP